MLGWWQDIVLKKSSTHASIHCYLLKERTGIILSNSQETFCLQIEEWEVMTDKLWFQLNTGNLLKTLLPFPLESGYWFTHWSPYTERLKKEEDPSILVGDRFNNQGNLPIRRVLDDRKMSRSPSLPTQILRFIQRP